MKLLRICSDSDEEEILTVVSDTDGETDSKSEVKLWH